MGIDIVHGRITTEKTGYTPIGDDEPVAIFRGQDKHVLALLNLYHSLCVKDGSPPEFLRVINENMTRFLNWQHENGCRTPGLSFQKENHERGGSETRIPETGLGNNSP